VSRNTRTVPAPRRRSGDTAPAAGASHLLRIPREPRALSRTWTRRFPPPGAVSRAANATPLRVNTRAPGSRSRAPGLHITRPSWSRVPRHPAVVVPGLTSPGRRGTASNLFRGRRGGGPASAAGSPPLSRARAVKGRCAGVLRCGGPASAVRARQTIILERLRYMEGKRAQEMRKFQLLQKLHAKAVGMNAAFSTDQACSAF